MQTSNQYGATPPYESGIVHTIRDVQPAAGFDCVAVRFVLGQPLYEWRKAAESERQPLPSFIPVEAAHSLRVVAWPRL